VVRSGPSEDLPADEAAPARVRRLLRIWLHVQGLGSDETWDIVQAVDEAVTNTVRHAYLESEAPGPVMIDCWIQPDVTRERVVVMVTDNGRWRASSPSAGHQGRGLRLMRNCCESVRVESSEHGTTVTLVSRYIEGTS
jgi:anti-sigma regulatory factor (Ser/Thr protein kinase)